MDDIYAMLLQQIYINSTLISLKRKTKPKSHTKEKYKI